MTEALTLLVPALAMALLHFLWQGALVGLLAWLALSLLRNARPQMRYAVACLALLACVLLPAWNLAQALSGSNVVHVMLVAPETGSPGATASTAQAAALRMLAAPSPDALPWIVVLWAVGAGTLSLRMACGLFWVRRLCRGAQADAGGRWQACVDRLAPALGIGRRVVLRLVEAGDSPLAAGWWRPVVLLPAAVAARVPAHLIEALIAHELAHVRRHDYLVNLLQGAAEALLFYHPVVWWLSHRIRIERELVADDLAIAALGEPRRLALALAELDRHAGTRSPIPPPHYAPAAHGGHLMSRIQQLVRPQRRPIAGIVVLPMIGLALAGAAFYAHAQLSALQEVSAQVTPVPTAAARTLPPPTAAATARPLPAPVAAPGAQVLPAPEAAPATLQAGAEAEPIDRDRSGYALVNGNDEKVRMNGDLRDIDAIRAARHRIDGDFLWFRRDGKAWVIRDAETVARARETWRGTDALTAQMQVLEARMKPHNERLEALGARMDALAKSNAFESPEARAATARTEALSGQMESVAERQVALAMRMQEAGAADQSRLQREQAELARHQRALEAEMARHGDTLESLGAYMEAQSAPMEALGREMEAAGEPMKAIGKEMETLGARLERQVQLADGQLRKLIDEAYRSGRAQPSPVQR